MRWLVSAAIVVCLHVAAARALLHVAPAEESSETAGAFVIELAPMAVARADVPPEVTPGPDQLQADAAPPKIERPEQQPDEPPDKVVENTDVSLPTSPLKREEAPEDQAVPQTPVAATTATQIESERTAGIAAGPVVGAPQARDRKAIPNWQAKIATMLERIKRYPAGALSRGEQGTVHVSFTIDRHGRLLASRVARTSGSPTLDAEAQAILQRAQPFPVPPTEIAGPEIALTVPIQFNVR